MFELLKIMKDKTEIIVLRDDIKFSDGNGVYDFR